MKQVESYSSDSAGRRVERLKWGVSTISEFSQMTCFNAEHSPVAAAFGEACGPHSLSLRITTVLSVGRPGRRHCTQAKIGFVQDAMHKEHLC